MRTGTPVVALAVFLLIASPASSYAEWQFTPFIGQTFKGSTTLIDPLLASDDGHWNLGGSVTLIGDGPFGLEAYYVRTFGFFERHRSIRDLPGSPTINSSRSQALMGNAVLAMPRNVNRYGLRPFLSGGLGVLHASHDDPFLPVRVNLLAMNVGGGATGFITDRVGVRFDLRYFKNVRGVGDDHELAPVSVTGESVRIHYWVGAIGVVFKY